MHYNTILGLATLYVYMGIPVYQLNHKLSCIH